MYAYTFGPYASAPLPPKPQSGPHACLRRSSGGIHRAWCSREPLALEYVFQDADYAAEHYDRRSNALLHRGVPAACEKCVDAMRAEREREEEGRKK